MIDDLFTELALGSVQRLLSGEEPRDAAEFGLARLNGRLSTPAAGEEHAMRPEPAPLRSHLLDRYLQLAAGDLQQIPPAVHEWVLERLPPALVRGERGLETLTILYFLFPDSTVRSAVVGLLVEADEAEPGEREGRTPPLAVIVRAIDDDAGVSDAARVEQARILVDLLLDYPASFPEATGRALALLLDLPYADDALRRHLDAWAERLGGETGARIRRVLGSSGRSE